MAKVIALASLLLLVPSLADAAPPRVGVLLPGNEWTSAFDGLREGMKELGYVEGRDIQYLVENAQSDTRRVAALTEKFKTEKVDLIFTVTNTVLKVVADVTRATKPAAIPDTNITEAASSIAAFAAARETAPKLGLILLEFRVGSRQEAIDAVYQVEHVRKSGALLSYGSSYFLQGKQSAALVDKILKGTPPGRLPIERPKLHQLIINVETAAAIGVTFSREALNRADELVGSVTK